MGWIAAHRKAILGALAALGGIAAVIAAHQEWGAVAQWAGVVVAVLSAAGVYGVPNQPASSTAAAGAAGASAAAPPPSG